MTSPDSGAERRLSAAGGAIAGRRAGRRRFLTGIGATGLAVAAATFGRAMPAYAVTEGCCGLPNPPGSECYTTWSYCLSIKKYVWTCSGPGPRGTQYRCSCCETKVDAQKGLCPNGKSSSTCITVSA